MSNFTPGPWIADAVLHRDAEEFDICLGYDTPGCGSPVIIASAMDDSDDDDHEGWPISRKAANANARLMAAAPDLLEACQLIRDSLGIRKDFAPLGTLDFAGKLLTAIAKATGEKL